MEQVPDVLITRTFDASRSRVWVAWTDPVEAMKWWGPKIFTCPVAEIDAQVGGKYLLCMRDAQGNDYWSTGKYQEVIPMEKLVMTDSFSNANGDVVSPREYGMSPEFPLECIVTVTLADVGEGKTEMTLRHQGIPAGITEDCTMGWNQQFDKLAEALK
jgi:uncharacterized protein YndB with AHSA1/START domain